MIREFGRYAATGILSVALNTLIIVVLTELAGFHYLVSTAICFVTVMLTSFTLNRFWTFRKMTGSVSIDLGRYATVAILNLLLSVGLSYLLVEHLGVRYEFAAAALSLIVAPVSFLVHRRWSFALRWPARGS